MKINGYHLFTILACLIMALPACDDIFVEDISNKTLDLVSPPDQYVTPVSYQQFRWDKDKQFEEYHFMLVSPSFDSLVTVLYDTLLTENKLNLTLPPAFMSGAQGA